MDKNTEIELHVNRLIERVEDSGLPDESKIALTESLSRAISSMLTFEDTFWTRWGGVNPFGAKNFITLDAIKQLADKGEELSESNPLLRRGKSLKTDHATSYGFWFEFPESAKSGDRSKSGRGGNNREAYDKNILGIGALPPRKRTALVDPINVDIMFSDIAIRELNDTVFAKGNAYRGYDEVQERFYRIPISQITGVVSDDSDISLTQYYQRTYSKVDDIVTGNAIEIVEWIPTDYQKYRVERKLAKHPRTISGQPVNIEHTIIDFSPNRGEGQIFGLPDCFAAVPWAMGYSEYLKDGQKLLSAYAAIAIQVKAKTRGEAEKLGVKISEATSMGGSKAGVVAGTEGFEVSAVGRTNAVDLLTGLPLLAQAASAMDLSRNNLASFATEGGYGSASSISETEKLAAQARQRELSAFYRRVFRLVGLDDGVLRWNRIVTEPIQRLALAAATLMSFGAVSRAEVRPKALEWLDIEDANVDDLPEPDLFTGSKAASLPEYLDALSQDDDILDDPTPRQGNKGVGSMTDNNQARTDDDIK